MLPAFPRRAFLALILITAAYLFYTALSGTDSLLAQWSPQSTHEPFRWRDYKQHYPVSRYERLPTSKARAIPQIQAPHHPESSAERMETVAHLNAVKQEFKHAWNGYRKHAWLKDEVGPISGRPNNAFGGWGATLVDSLDTLWMMDMKSDFEQAVTALDSISFSSSISDRISVFETNIRYLGGLLSAYDISNHQYKVILKKAVEVGDMLYAAFDTPNRLPVPYWYLSQARNGSAQNAPYSASLAEYGTFTLEFTRLSQLTGDHKYYDAVNRLTDMFAQIQNTSSLPGLWPTMVTVNDRIYSSFGNSYTFGAMADSMYEYLPKQYLLVRGRQDKYQVMYNTAMEAARKHLIFRPIAPNNSDILFTGSATGWTKENLQSNGEMQHLTCFVGGMVALAAKVFSQEEDDMHMAAQLTQGCVWSYAVMPSGIGPEVFSMRRCDVDIDDTDTTACEWDGAGITGDNRLRGFSAVTDPSYKLRPEAIESVFIMWRITGDRKWREKGWAMFEAIRKHTRTDIAHAAVHDVSVDQITLEDKMESFWLGETLKYFYLLFADPKVVSLDRFVFNTEAHPLLWRDDHDD